MSLSQQKTPQFTRSPPVLNGDGTQCFNCYWTRGVKLLRCVDCKFAAYCNKTCQREHYKQHKSRCAHFARFKRTEDNLPEFAKNLILYENYHFTMCFSECPDKMQSKSI
ncbi:histone-lysine N-methyltransferase SMYD1 [Elysia marginata]|uniref:Histone-lysine N-methyltransferase SMYD1 n=1 Tax=Elysia marginata TaxID=1093978 RepID=A0AAV4GH15_9GAST|nr:histone-lysine N-methyltransferase SMYD1 [Elysia marginata]